MKQTHFNRPLANSVSVDTKPKTRKMKIVAIALGAAIIASSCSLSFAWITFSHTKNNQLTSGGVSTKIVQNFTQPKTLSPGLSFTDDPHIQNTGNLPCFVRATIKFSNSVGQSECENLTIGENWMYDASDDHYYYTKVLAPGESTSNLFSQVKVKDTAKVDDLQNLDIDVLEEAVQQGTLPEASYKEGFSL